MLIYGRSLTNVCAHRRACVCEQAMQNKSVFGVEADILRVHSCISVPLLFEGPSVVLKWGGLGQTREAFEIQKLAHCERASLFSLSFPLSPLKNTE